MRKNKTKLVVIISIIIVVILIVWILLFITFFTDVLKSNKEKFFKSAFTTIMDSEDYANIEKYFKKQINTPFESNGTYTTYIKDKNESILNNKEQNVLNKTNITFNGKVDILNELASENISVDYTKDIKIPVNLIISKTLFGVQSDYLAKKYFTTNIQANQFIDEYLNNNKSNAELEKKYEELKEIFNKNSKNYIDAVINTIDDNKFIKVNEDGINGYSANLNIDDIKNMIMAILQTLKTDQEMLNTINEIKNIIASSADNITPQLIDEYIQELNEYTPSSTNIDDFTSEINNQTNIEITVFTIDKNLSRILVKSEGTIIEIKKECDDDKIGIEISLKNEEQFNIQFKAEFDGLKNEDNVTENYEISYNINDIDSTHNLTRNVKFVSNIDVEELNEENSINMDDLETEQILDLQNKITKRIEEVNKMQMEKLEIEKDDILMYEVPFVGFIYGAFNSTTSNMESEVIKSFNYRFEPYLGESVKGSQINDMIENIRIINESEENKKIKIKANVTKWNQDLNRADNESTYKVTCEYDEEGYINTIILEDAD